MVQLSEPTRPWKWRSSRGRSSLRLGSTSTGGYESPADSASLFSVDKTSVRVQKLCVLAFTCSREDTDKDYAYSITTRVPECFGSGLPCHRLEQAYSLGPLHLNTEVVLRTSTALKNNRTLYSDDNGYQMMKRAYKEFANNTLARVGSV